MGLMTMNSFATAAAFLVAAGLTYLVLGSVADVAWIWMSDTSDSVRPYGGPQPVMWSDRIVVALIHRFRDRRVAAARMEPLPAILMTGPQPALPAQASGERMPAPPERSKQST